MSNTSRRLPNRDNKMFIPVAISGAGTDEYGKVGGSVFVIGITATIVYALLIINVIQSETNVIFKTAVIIVLTYLITLLIRKAVIREGDKLANYRKHKSLGISTPKLLWKIYDIEDTANGDIIKYNNGRVAVLVRLNRDTLLGRSDNFKEQHYDSISEVYRRLNFANISYITMNIMSEAGNDNREIALDFLVENSKFNSKLNDLMKLQSNHLKSATKNKLYEYEYILCYTNIEQSGKSLIEEVDKALVNIYNGAYTGYDILFEEDIMEFAREYYGVGIFNKNSVINNYSDIDTYGSTFKITAIIDEEDNEIEFTKNYNSQEYIKQPRRINKRMKK